MIFERILVGSEVTSVWDGLIRGPTCLGRSDQRRFRARPQPGYGPDRTDQEWGVGQIEYTKKFGTGRTERNKNCA